MLKLDEITKAMSLFYQVVKRLGLEIGPTNIMQAGPGATCVTPRYVMSGWKDIKETKTVDESLKKKLIKEIADEVERRVRQDATMWVAVSMPTIMVTCDVHDKGVLEPSVLAYVHFYPKAEDEKSQSNQEGTAQTQTA